MHEPSLRKSKILIVDDEPEVAELLGQMLEEEGYQAIESTNDPFVAVELFGKFQPDLVLLDLLMPGRSGQDVLAQLRTLIPPRTYLPILVVTADSTFPTRRAALTGGATDFINKPFDPVELLARVGNLLETRQLHRQLALQNAELIDEAAQRSEMEAALRRQRDALRESDARFQRVAANSPGMIYQFILRADGSMAFPYVSEGSRSLFALEPMELEADADLLIRRIHPTEMERFYRSVTESAATLCDWQWEGRFLDSAGGEIWIQGASRPERRANGDVVWDGMLMDITARKQAEARALQAREEAERANAAKSDFLSRMSHELRTPLHAILGFAQLLENEGQSLEEADNIAQILKAGKRLLALVDEVLESRPAPGE